MPAATAASRPIICPPAYSPLATSAAYELTAMLPSALVPTARSICPMMRTTEDAASCANPVITQLSESCTAQPTSPMSAPPAFTSAEDCVTELRQFGRGVLTPLPKRTSSAPPAGTGACVVNWTAIQTPVEPDLRIEASLSTLTDEEVNPVAIASQDAAEILLVICPEKRFPVQT